MKTCRTCGESYEPESGWMHICTEARGPDDGAARGVILGIALSIALWAVILAVVWLVLR